VVGLAAAAAASTTCGFFLPFHSAPRDVTNYSAPPAASPLSPTHPPTGTRVPRSAEQGREEAMAVVGVLALQGSYNEHMAGTESDFVSLCCPPDGRCSCC
jgi:hypothetical protein